MNLRKVEIIEPEGIMVRRITISFLFIFAVLIGLLVSTQTAHAASFSYEWTAIDGNTISTDEKGYKATVLVFGRPTCSNTIIAVQSIATSNWINSNDVRVIFGDIDGNDKSKVSDFAARRNNPPIIFCYDTSGNIEQHMWEYYRSYYGSANSTMLPVIVLIDEDNTVRNVLSGPQTEESILEAIEYFTTISYANKVQSSSSHKHKEVIMPAKAATCTEEGYTEGKKCSECGTVLVAQKTIAATGHKEIIVPSMAPATCTGEGFTDGKECSVCGTVTVSQDIIEPTGHKEVIMPAKAATCTESGLTEGSRCSRCGIVINAQTVVAAKGHSWSSWKTTKAATALAKGTKTKTCTICNKKQKKSIAKLKATIKLSKISVTLKKGKTVTIKVSGLAKGDKVKSWTSSNKKIATVSKKGKITAKKKGTTTITVKLASGKKAKVKVRVK